MERVWDFSKPKILPSPARQERCKTLIRVTLRHQETFLTSYDTYGLILEHLEASVLPDAKELSKEINDKAMKNPHKDHSNFLRSLFEAGVRMDWLQPKWVGTGMTPWAGAPRRQRVYVITQKGLDAVGG